MFVVEADIHHMKVGGYWPEEAGNQLVYKHSASVLVAARQEGLQEYTVSLIVAEELV